LQSFQRQRQALRRGFDRIGVAHRHPRRQSRRTTCEKRATAIIYDEKLTSYRWKTSTPRRALCMTALARRRGIDLHVSHVISPPPVPSYFLSKAARRIAPRLQVPIAGAIPGPIAGVMTKPDRLSTANAVAEASAFSTAAAEPHGEAVSRADHDRMANAIRALAMDAVEQPKSGHPGFPMAPPDIPPVLFTRLLTFDPAHPAW